MKKIFLNFLIFMLIGLVAEFSIADVCSSIKQDVASFTDSFMMNMLSTSPGATGFRDIMQGMSNGEIADVLRNDWVSFLPPGQH